MPAPVLLKLGGALLTDKDGREAPRRDLLDRLAAEIAGWAKTATAPLILAHGSGSYAHVAVRETGFLERPSDPLALARVASAAARLDRLVVEALLSHGLPAIPVPGSILAVCEDGRIHSLRSEIVAELLAQGLLPVIYGDAAPDRLRGGAIASTEPLMAGLARVLHPLRVILATDVDGVFDRDPHSGGAQRYARITPADRQRVMRSLGGARSGAVDVTGGMASKVGQMLELVADLPLTQVRILSGLREGAIAAALAGRADAGGTLIEAGGAAPAAPG
jgi:isopentenyl phosphate kinase